MARMPSPLAGALTGQLKRLRPMRSAVRALIAVLLLTPLLPAAVPPQSDAFNAFYNLDYDKALSLFAQATKDDPSSPDAWNQLAQGILYRRLYLAGSLQSELVGKSNSFLRRPKVEMPPEEERRFLEANERAIRICLDRLGENPNDAGALYALGVAHAHRGNFRFLCQKAYIDALRDATRSRNMHSRLQKVHGGNPDAMLIPAMHDYISGSLPLMVRIFASMAGFRGDRERGIVNVERAVRAGKRTGVEARVLLSIIYNREGKPEKAVPLMAELSEAFPRNYLYRSECALLLARAGRKAEALRALEEMEKMKANNAQELSLLDASRLKRLRELVEKHLRESE